MTMDSGGYESTIRELTRRINALAVHPLRRARRT